MQDRRTLFATIAAGAAALFGSRLAAGAPARAQAGGFPVQKTPEEWRGSLSTMQYQVLRQHDTEPPGSSPLNHEARKGTFVCAGCEQPLFSSDTKYDSGTGWPSFWRPLPDAVATGAGRSPMMTRVEVHCRRCGGHLGHVFHDGPRPTGLRYCMNGAAMLFRRQAAA
jgi:peptide-methionine (R)-S-oxide reductase